MTQVGGVNVAVLLDRPDLWGAVEGAMALSPGGPPRFTILSSHEEVLRRASAVGAVACDLLPTPAALSVVPEEIRDEVRRIDLEGSIRGGPPFAAEFLRAVFEHAANHHAESPHRFERILRDSGARLALTVNFLYRRLRRHLWGYVLALRHLGLPWIDLSLGPVPPRRRWLLRRFPWIGLGRPRPGKAVRWRGGDGPDAFWEAAPAARADLEAIGVARLPRESFVHLLRGA